MTAKDAAKVFLTLYANAGFRKEAVALGVGETLGPRKLKLSDVVYKFDGVVSRHPSAAQLAAALRGDFLEVIVYVLPVPCKNDPDNRKFGNSPIPSRLHLTRTVNFAREMIQYELWRHTEGTDRSKAPLLMAPGSGGLYTKRALDVYFKRLFSHVCTPQRLAQISVHSLRVYCACALLAAGATPEQVMLLVRWSSESARKLYARVADTTQIGLLEGASEVAIDTVRTHTLLAAAAAAVPSTRAGEAAADRAVREQAEAAVAAAHAALSRVNAEEQQRAQRLLEGTDLLARAEAVNGTASLSELRRRGVVIDDDNVYARINSSEDALRSSAARFDASVAVGAAGEGGRDDDGDADSE